MNDTRDLGGRTALVTGAGSGIGRAVAAALAEHGARLVLVGRRSEKLADTAARVSAAGGEALTIVADVGAAADVARVASEAGAIDVLVHGAASHASYGPLEERPAAEVDDALHSILGGALHLAAAFLAGMKERGYGRLLFLGSVAAETGASGQVVYASAKAGLRGLVRSLAAEAGRAGVTANLLELGLIDTERTREEVREDVRVRIAANTAVGRAGSPEEVAAAAAWLASPEASYVNGAVLPIDGGFGLGLVPRRPRT